MRLCSHMQIFQRDLVLDGANQREMQTNTLYIYMCVCMSVCVYKPVLQQWQRLVFSGCQTSAGWKPKTNILFIKKTPRIQMQDQTNKMLNQKLYKQWLNIKFASCIGLEKIWKTLNSWVFMDVRGCSWDRCSCVFVWVCFCSHLFWEIRKLRGGPWVIVQPWAWLFFAFFCRKFRENPKWLANPGFEMHFAKSL